MILCDDQGLSLSLPLITRKMRLLCFILGKIRATDGYFSNGVAAFIVFTCYHDAWTGLLILAGVFNYS